MGRRNRKSAANSIISDTVFIGSRLPWWGALIFGACSFLLFYFVIPSWLEAKLASQSQNMFYPMLEAIFGRRMHWFEWLGIACGLIGLFFCIRNYLYLNQADYYERGIVGIIAKILGRDLE